MRRVIILAVGLIILSLCLVIYKVAVLKYFLTEKPPHPLWRVRFQIQFEGRDEKIKVGLLLPQNLFRQRIYDERVEGNGFRFSIKDVELGNNRRGYWERDEAKGRKMLSYEFSVKAKEGSVFKEDFLEDKEEWLKPTKLIPKKKPIRNLAKGIAGGIRDEEEKAETLYQYVRDNIRNSTKKRGDRPGAYVTLLEKEGTSQGKARLLCALLRSSGIPSRVVGGLILEEGIEKDIHFWIEAYLKDGWVPFCPTNGYAREIPSNYLILYQGDLPLIKKRGVKKFEYLITVEKEKRKHIEFISRLEKRGVIENRYSLFSLPLAIQRLVRILLVVPLGALVITIFRNIIGIRTFGTFTPILMALAFRGTKLGWGLLFFFLVVAVGCLTRAGLDRMKLLFIPRLAILVTLVITTMIIFTLVGYHTGLGQVLSVALFPMVIMTMVIERFSVTQMEIGTRAVLLISLGTIIVASIGYIVMSSELLQLTMFSFPELLLAVIGILILLGRYSGLRLTELWRFRALREK